jgi:vacuolar-type H+-ATPase subunit F/Vma7
MLIMRRIVIIFFSLLLLSSYSFAQKEKYESLFIYNFTKYIKWPDTYNEGRFLIGVLGNSDIYGSLQTMAGTKKKTGTGAAIEVKKYESFEDMDDCNILFISTDAIDNLTEIEEATANKPVLIITDTPGMANQGSVINFVEKDGKIKFELNQAKAESRNLIISGSLSNLAILL